MSENVQSIREVSRRVGCSLTTLRRRVAKWNLKSPYNLNDIAARLQADPPKEWLSRSGKTAPGVARSSAPPITDGADEIAPSLDDLERRLRLARDVTVAETLSKQVRGLKVLQEVRVNEGRVIDAEKAREEIASVFTMFQTRLMAESGPLPPMLVGLDSLEIKTILDGRFTEILADLRKGLEDAIKPETIQGNKQGADTAGDASAESMVGEVSETDEKAE